MPVTFRPADPALPPAADLITAMAAELTELYRDVDAGVAPVPVTAAELRPPRGACVVGWDDRGEPVAVGGVRTLGDGVGEVKRMYVLPAARGRGLARALLAALEDEARALGHARLRLDTGPRQGAAEALYRSAGYAEVERYNANPYASFWAEKRL